MDFKSRHCKINVKEGNITSTETVESHEVIKHIYVVKSLITENVIGKQW